MFLNICFDTSTNTVLGRGGRWVTFAEFAKDPPQIPEDLVPPPVAGNEPIDDPDPGPTYKCINHQLYVCSGLSCTKVLRNGSPVPCP